MAAVTVTLIANHDRETKSGWRKHVEFVRKIEKTGRMDQVEAEVIFGVKEYQPPLYEIPKEWRKYVTQ